MISDKKYLSRNLLLVFSFYPIATISVMQVGCNWKIEKASSGEVKSFENGRKERDEEKKITQKISFGKSEPALTMQMTSY